MRVERSAVVVGQAAWTLAEHSPDAHIVCHRDVISYANPAALALLRAQRGESLIGSRFVDLASNPVHRSALEDWLATIRLDNPAASAEVCLHRKDGQSLWVRVLGTALVLEGELAIEVVLRDVAPHWLRDSARALAERVSTSGALAAGVAHAINNPLAYILINLDFVTGQLDEVGRLGESDLAEVREAMAEAREGAQQMSRIIQALKVFGADADDSPWSTDLHAVVASVLELAQGAIRLRARLVTDLQPTPLVRGRQATLGQLLLGLVLEEIRILGEHESRDAEIRIETRVQAGTVVLEVACSAPMRAPELGDLSAVPQARARTAAPMPDLGLCRALVAEVGGVLVGDWTGRSGGWIRAHLPPAPARSSARSDV